MSADRETGNCFKIAADIAVDPDRAEQGWVAGMVDGKERVLVHAEVTGHGPIAGQRYVHAWVEIEGHIAIDLSNGNTVICLVDEYHKNAKVHPDKIIKYTPKEAIRNMVDHQHYGPWDCTGENAWDKSKKR